MPLACNRSMDDSDAHYVYYAPMSFSMLAELSWNQNNMAIR